MQIKIYPGMAKNVSLAVPASKSLSHRYLLAASLAQGKSILSHVADNLDVQATKNCLMHLGITMREVNSCAEIWGREQFCYDGAVLDCGESGSTLRFLMPVAALCKNPVHFTGHGRLLKRPLDIYRQLSAFAYDRNDQGIVVRGPLKAGSYVVDGSISSQFLTGLLFSLPLVRGNSELYIQPPIVSKPYLDMTISVLKECGIFVAVEGMHLSVPGNQHFHPLVKTIEGDMSAAAFFAVLAVLCGSTVMLQNLNVHSWQADRALFSILEKNGAHVEMNPVQISGKVRSLQEVDLKNCPDLGPILFVLASQCETRTVFLHTNRLRMKESDRLENMYDELGRLGISMEVKEDKVIIYPGRLHGNVHLSGHGDHRIVMALAIAAVCADGPVVIHGYEAVAKSYPSFFEDLRRCGVEMEKETQNENYGD